jgi:hypothetical protein
MITGVCTRLTYVIGDCDAYKSGFVQGVPSNAAFAHDERVA